MESQAPLVGSDGAVHLNPVTFVYLDLSLVINPGDPEKDHPLGLGHPLEDFCRPVLGIFHDKGHK